MRFVALSTALILLPCAAFAQAPQKEQLPTGKQYLVGQLAAAEAKVSDMLDEIAMLRKQIESLKQGEQKK